MFSRNSISSDCKDLLESARTRFENGEAATAEAMLNQIVLMNNRIPEVFVMLGTLAYDQGKFSKAIKFYRRALEVESGYVDASVALSMLLNDLGRYEEAKQVFDEARKAQEEQQKKADPFIEKRLQAKHVELGDLYFQNGRFDDAAEEYTKALGYSAEGTELRMKIVDCQVSQDNLPLALRELRALIRDFPKFSAARIKLGSILYGASQVADAVEQWEAALDLDPGNAEVRTYLKMAQNSTQTTLNT